MDKNLHILIKAITDAPVWVQEVILHDLKSHLETFAPNVLETPKEDVYALFVPELTFKGKKELETREHGHELNVYKFLTTVNEKIRVIDLTLRNFWTLEECSRYLSLSIKNEYIKKPENPFVNAAILYLGNEIRLGEYVKRVSLINVDQLEAALRRQKEINKDTHSYTKLGGVLVDLGFIVEDDIKKILNIKSESEKRFIPTLDLSKTGDTGGVNFKEMQQKIEKLTKENALLKEKLRAIFNIQSKKKAE